MYLPCKCFGNFSLGVHFSFTYNKKKILLFKNFVFNAGILSVLLLFKDLRLVQRMHFLLVKLISSLHILQHFHPCVIVISHLFLNLHLMNFYRKVCFILQKKTRASQHESIPYNITIYPGIVFNVRYLYMHFSSFFILSLLKGYCYLETFKYWVRCQNE